MSIGTENGAAADGCPCGCGAAEKAHCWKESDWEESSAARALRAENEHLRNVIAGLEQGNREAHQGIAKQKAANERLRVEVAEEEASRERADEREADARLARDEARADVERLRAEVDSLRAVIVRANNALFSVGPDIQDAEHMIECHADTATEAYRRLAVGANEAWGVLTAAVADMVEPKA
jgi:chromosome segregation ATPase